MAARTIQPSSRFRLLHKIVNRPFEVRCCNMGVLTMTVEAPSHGEWSGLFHPFHVFHSPMAPLASHTGKYMLAVIEVNEIGKVMYLDPPDRPAFLHSLFELLDLDSLLFE